jgi:hypothetical protein
MRRSLFLLATSGIIWLAFSGTTEGGYGQYWAAPQCASAEPANGVSSSNGYCWGCAAACCPRTRGACGGPADCQRGFCGHGCGHRLTAKKAAVGCFNCQCRGSYKFPVPPQYTYHWPGMYAQQTMTEHNSPYRFPPLNPPGDAFGPPSDGPDTDQAPGPVAPPETTPLPDDLPDAPEAPVVQPRRSAEPGRLRRGCQEVGNGQPEDEAVLRGLVGGVEAA